MSNEEVLVHIQELQKEIEALDACSDDVRMRLADLVADVQTAIESEDENPDWGDLARTIRSHVEQFEFEHPRLTRALDQIMNTLNSMGI